eukprot:2700546-Pleurochrysis_carterae.AAC.1
MDTQQSHVYRNSSSRSILRALSRHFVGAIQYAFRSTLLSRPQANAIFTLKRSTGDTKTVLNSPLSASFAIVHPSGNDSGRVYVALSVNCAERGQTDVLSAVAHITPSLWQIVPPSPPPNHKAAQQTCSRDPGASSRLCRLRLQSGANAQATGPPHPVERASSAHVS